MPGILGVRTFVFSAELEIEMDENSQGLFTWSLRSSVLSAMYVYYTRCGMAVDGIFRVGGCDYRDSPQIAVGWQIVSYRDLRQIAVGWKIVSQKCD